MQDAIPAAPELPVISLSPEVRVLIGQNQIRRSFAFFTENYKGADVRTSSRLMDAGDTLTITEPVLALVLDASAPIQFSFTYYPNGNTNPTATVTTMNKLLIWDQALTGMVIHNTSASPIQLQLAYAVPLPTA